MLNDRYSYVAVFTYEDDGISIEFPDLPGCLPCADKDDTEGAFKKILKKEGYRSEDIFLMTCTPQLDYYIVPMNKR